jgi:hypothetical protein
LIVISIKETNKVQYGHEIMIKAVMLIWCSAWRKV